MKGDFNTNYYVCGNYEDDFIELYEQEYIPKVDKPEYELEYLFGMMVFNKNNFSKNAEALIQSLFSNANMIVELHGVAPDCVNLGIYLENLRELPQSIKKCFVAKQVSDYEFEIIPNDKYKVGKK